MVGRTKKARAAAGAGVILASLGLVALALTAGQGGAAAATEQERSVLGEARSGSLTVGLMPALMFVTGVIMWWQRVMRKRPVRVEVTGTEEAA